MKTITYDDSAWKLVPVEPTQEMWAAFRNTDHGNIWFHQAYRAMFAATPTPPASEQQREVVMPEFMASADDFAERLHAAGWRAEADAQHAGVRELYAELLRLNPHLAKGEGV